MKCKNCNYDHYEYYPNELCNIINKINKKVHNISIKSIKNNDKCFLIEFEDKTLKFVLIDDMAEDVVKLNNICQSFMFNNTANKIVLYETLNELKKLI